jgi:Tol biopolymer transport system component
VYRADQDADDVFELYLVSAASPGISVKLSGPLVTGGWVRSGFDFSPDGNKVVYRADEDTYDTVELYVVDVASPGNSTKVNSTLTSGGNVYTSFAFSPDSNRVAYVADQDTDEQLELYSAAVATLGTTSKLNGTLIPAGDVCRFEWSPDSQRVAYCADQEIDEVMELYTVPVNSPGQSVKMNPPLVSGGKVTTGYDFSADSSFMVYAASQESATRTDLYRVEIATPGVATKVNAPLVADGNVVGFRIRKDGAQVAYVANQDDAGVYEVYQADFLTPGVSTKLSGTMKATGAYRVRYDADGQHVIYMADQDSDAAEIYRVDLAAPGISTKLNGPLVTGGEVWDFDLAQ